MAVGLPAPASEPKMQTGSTSNWPQYTLGKSFTSYLERTRQVPVHQVYSVLVIGVTLLVLFFVLVYVLITSHAEEARGDTSDYPLLTEPGSATGSDDTAPRRRTTSPLTLMTSSARTSGRSTVGTTGPVTVGTTESSTVGTTDSRSVGTTHPGTTSMSTQRPWNSNRSYTLVCVFEYLGDTLWDKKYECTDYVFIRIFSLSMTESGEDFKFTVDINDKRAHDEKLIAEELERKIRHNFETARRTFSYATWYLGMWGGIYTRMRSLASLDLLGTKLKTYINTEMQVNGLNKSDFDGLAIINTLPPTNIVDHLFEESLPRYKGNIREVLVPSGWRFLHTIAPLWDRFYYWNKYMDHNLRHADLAGITTSYTLYLPEKAMPAQMQLQGFRPPNPVGLKPQPFDNMVDTVKYFERWASIMHRQGLCFSITTAINKMRVNENENMFEVEIATRRMEKLTRRTLPKRVYLKNVTLKEQDPTYSYVHIHNGLGIILDMANTIKYKVRELFKAHNTSRCLVFDDIGDDSNELVIRDKSVKPYAFLQAISEIMTERYGPAFRG